MNEILLSSLLSLIKNERDIKIRIYDENELLLIKFYLSGFRQLKADLLSRTVKEIYTTSVEDVDIILNASEN